jgi:hypothetical protein
MKRIQQCGISTSLRLLCLLKKHLILLVLLMIISGQAIAQMGVAPVQSPPIGFGIEGDGSANFPATSPYTNTGDWWQGSDPTSTNYLLYQVTPAGQEPQVMVNSLYALHTVHFNDPWDGEDPTTFTNSTKVDDPYGTSFTWGPGMNPNKNEINRATAHFTFGSNVSPLNGDPADLWCLFSADRQVNNGEAYIDFEFLQSSVTMVYNDPLNEALGGYFTSTGTDGTRTEGDILVTIMFTRGGNVPTPVIHRWEMTSHGWDYVEQPLSFYQGKVLMTSNQAVITPPWSPYGQPSYDINQFAEGAINLSALMGFSNSPCGYISTVFVRTKTSQSSTAELKDFPGAPYQVGINLSELEVVCSSNVSLDACTSQSAIETAYNSWVAGFTNSGGYGTVVTNILDIPALPANIACGGSISFTYTVSDECNPEGISCEERTFSVAPAPDLIVNCPGNVELPACTSAADIVSAYNTWIAGFSVSGGCSPTSNIATIAAAPPTNYVCGFTYPFTLTASNATGYCVDNATCTSTFSVAAAPLLIIQCPGNVNLPACTSAADILTAYNTWISGFSVSGGCSPTSNISSIAPAPPTNYACGFTYSFTLTANNGTGFCPGTASCTSTFTVAAAPDLVANCPGNVNLPACTSATAIVTAYNTWKAGFSVSGGCSPTSNITSIAAAPPTNYACGFTYSFTLTANNAAGYCVDNASCTSTFTVAAAPDLVVNCPGNVNLPACSSVAEIVSAYNTWKAGFSISGGCSPTSNITSIAATPPTNFACGFTYSFTLTANNATGYCVDNATCTSTFTVAAAPDLVANCPGDVILPACTSATAIVTAYNTWKAGFSVTGGCSPTSNIASIAAAPPTNFACGFTYSFTLTANNAAGYCVDNATCTSTFTVAAAPDLVANCPGNINLPACTSAAEIVSAYNTWKAGFSVSGGCSPTSNIASIAAAPPTNFACGFTYSFTLTANNAAGYCVDNATCTSTFTVAAAPDLVANCPGNVNLPACTSATAIVTAYNTWKAGFSVSGGCSPTSNIASIAAAPPTNYACGFTYSFTLTAINAAGYCVDNASCTSTFTVAAAPDLVVNCPGNVNLPACSSAAEIVSAYNTWKAGFSISGGCSPTSNITSIAATPPTNYACGFTYSFTLTANNATGYCVDNATCTSTFTVAAAPDLVANCPGNVNLPACTSATAIVTAYNTWKAGFSVSGGCSPTSNIASIAAAPPTNYACGFTYSFTLTANNAAGYCVDNATCTSTFTVAAAPDLVANCPGNVNLPACTSATAIVTAYNTWKAGFSVSGGCSPTSNIASIAAVPPTNYACGFTYSFTLTANNAAGYCVDNATCTSTFTVAAAPDLVANCPGNVNLPACTSATAIVTAYNTWKAGFSVSGGCSPTSNIATIAAAPPTNYACGFTYSFTLTANNAAGYCVDNATCTSTFTVAAAPDLVANCPGNVNLPACTSATAIVTAYNAWKAGFSVSGGCSPTSNITSIAAAPPTNFACGFTYSFTLTANNAAGYCVDNASCTSTFTVAPAPDLEITCSDNVIMPVCSTIEEIESAYMTWVDGFTFSGGCNASDNIGDIPVLPEDSNCEGANLEFTYTVVSDCETLECTSSFIVIPDITPPVFVSCPELPINLGTNPTNLPNSYYATEDAGIVTDECGVGIVAEGGEITGDCDFTQVWTVTATDDCGNQATCIVTYIWNIPCGLNLCTLTQGFYGNAGGAYCDGTTTINLLNSLLTTSLTIGTGNRSIVTYPVTGPNCVISTLPAGGQSSAIPVGGPYDLCSLPATMLRPDGSLKNNLIAQTLTMGLNLRLDADLCNLELESMYFYTRASSDCFDPDAYPIIGTELYYSLPVNVMTVLGSNNKVSDLYSLANRALGGEIISGCSLGDITTALGTLNSGLDQCRFIYFCSVPCAPVTSPQPGGNTTLTRLPNNNEAVLSVAPNPFSESTEIRYTLSTDSRVSLEVYNLYGTKVATLYEGEAKAGFDYTYRFDPVGNNSEQVFLVVLKTEFGTITKRVINTY